MTDWGFNLADLYSHQSVASMDFSAPFTCEEISSALFAMDMNASPGPDDFGPSFYKAFWSALKPRILELFASFFEGNLDMGGLNCAHLVLIPKYDGVRSPDGFHPISLQNCPMKLFTKVMANHLKRAIPTLIDVDQTGFVQGRNIAENYIYAADLVSCCYKRRVPTVVLKLDFKKAFDSVSWDSLDAILACRGFDDCR